jgi:L-cystine uptake protein TcyP (sodium:dicarboxylate symporter family)
MTTNNHSASHERPPAQKERRNVLGENLLTIVTIVGVIGEEAFSTSISFDCTKNNIISGGTVFGLILKNSGQQWTEREIMYIQYPGDLFLRMLKCLIVPLIVSSITSAIGALDLTLSKKIALR